MEQERYPHHCQPKRNTPSQLEGKIKTPFITTNLEEKHPHNRSQLTNIKTPFTTTKLKEPHRHNRSQVTTR
ncbi:hypothetical protein CHS0354_004284 [Potamilus streckersoni]|uniref:Uncharacterized protein n=1 Tax=Potamilus streckersoni TaxID=2493646 RepID=A0AAE0S4L3_9BIVA|nr:hypothetical protein CHS0354_004284 [Potamilus streckersoni]